MKAMLHDALRDTSSTSTAALAPMPTRPSPKWTWTPSARPLTTRQALVGTIHETGRHVGHADVVRELIDGMVGGARVDPYVLGRRSLVAR